MTDDSPPTLDYGRPAAGVRRFRRRTAFAAVAVCLWGPFGWLLLPSMVDSPWNSAHWSLIAMWAVLPGGIPGIVVAHAVGSGLWLAVPVAGGFTTAVAAGLTLLARRGVGQLAAAALIALLVAVPTSAVVYAIFRW